MFQLTRTSSPDPRLQPWNKSRRLNEQLGSVAGRARTPARQPAGRRRYIPRSISSEEKTMGLRNLTVSLTLLVTATLLASIGALKVSIKEYDVPTPKARPHDPAVSPDGALWVTEQMANKLGRLDPNTGQFREYPLKTSDSGPHGLVADKQGNIWFAAIFKGYMVSSIRNPVRLPNTACLIHTRKIRIHPFSIRRESCGSRSRNRAWSAGWIRARVMSK